MGWIKKNLGIILSILLVTFTIAVFGPLELYCTNSGEFWFSIKDAIVMTLILTVVCVGILSLISFLLRGKARNVFGAFVFAVGVALYIQGNYANINYGTLDGTEIDWNAYPVYAVLDTVGWVIVIAGLFVLYLKNKKWFKNIQIYASLYIVGIQVLTLAFLFLTSDVTTEKSDYYLSNEGMYEVSEKENIIIFVLDTFDDAYFQEIYKENPEKYEQIFADFTYFDNATAAAARTRAAMPAIISGKVYPGDISYIDYIKDAFNSDGMYTELKKQNYDVRLYTPSLYVPDESTELVDNQEMDGYVVNSHVGLTQKYFELTLYKYMPHVLKQYFWLYTGDFEKYKSGATAQSYVTDDLAFFAGMNLSATKDYKAFRLYHLNGAHGPYWLNEQAQKQEKYTDVLQQAKASLYMVETYINHLKALGVYDSSTIIVMADHGDANAEFNVDNAAHSILFVKTKGAESEFKILSTPVTHLELHATIFSELGVKNKGDTFFEVPEDDRTRYFYRYDMEQSAFYVEEYIVKGNVDDENSVTKTGRKLTPTIEEADYQYGTILTFGPNSTALPYVISGVSGTDEGNYTWTNGKECTFEFPLEEKPKNNLEVTIKTVSVFTKKGPQEIIVYANDALCYQTYLTNAGDIKFIVPGDVLGENNNLTLKLFLPNAISPRELFGGEEDRRTLSLALSGLCINETKDAPETIYSEMALGQKIVCTIDNNDVETYLKHGFSSPEKSFTWTDGKSASLVWVWKEIPVTDLNCTLKLSAVYGNYQTVKISFNGTNVYSKVLGSKDREISFTIPKECVQEGVSSCLIELPDAASPAELGTGNDKRVLALAVKEISFTEISNEDSEK